MDAIRSPVLDATLARLLVRARRRSRNATLARTVAAVAIAAALIAAWRIGDRVMGCEPMPVSRGAALVAAVAAAGLVAVAVAAVGGSEEQFARELDRRLALDDRAAAALAVARGRVTSALAAAVVRDAETSLTRDAARIDAAFPVRPGRDAMRLSRRLAKAAAVVVALAVLAELLAVGGPIRILPGRPAPGGTPEESASPTAAAPQGEGGRPDAREGGERPRSPAAGRKSDDPREPATQGDVRVAIRMTQDEFGAKEPVTATVSAAANGELPGASEFDVRVSVDGRDEDTGAVLRVDPARPAGERAEIDLRSVPGLKLTPGEHVAVARLTTRTSHEEHVSAPVRFRIDADKDESDSGHGGGGAPKERPQEPPPPEKRPSPNTPGAPSKKDEQPPAPPPPAAALERKVVVPLFGEGEEVRKKGLVLVLDPGGGDAGAPARGPIEDALPDARRRAEEAVDRAGVRAEDRDLVRRYFELLETLR